MPRKQSDGRYRAKITVGHDAAGKAITKYISARTRKELEAKKADMLRAYVSGATERRNDVLFGVYALEWYDTYKKSELSFSSRQSYATIFNVHLLPPLAERQLRAITANDLQQLLNSKRGMCVASIGYMHSILTHIFRRAYAQGLIDRDPTVGLTKPSAKKKSKRALTPAETSAALKVGRDHPQGLLILLLYYTGMRLGEAAGLQWQDVDFKNKIISVRRDVDFKVGEIGEVKTEYSLRDIPMPDELAVALEPRRGIGSTFVLQAPGGGHYKNSALNRLWLDLMCAMYAADDSIESRELDGGSIASALTAHYFRHNYASVLYNAGIDILSAQRFLGHAKASTTLEIYAHLSAEKEDQNAGQARDAFSKVAAKLPGTKKSDDTNVQKT